MLTNILYRQEQSLFGTDTMSDPDSIRIVIGTDPIQRNETLRKYARYPSHTREIVAFMISTQFENLKELLRIITEETVSYFNKLDEMQRTNDMVRRSIERKERSMVEYIGSMNNTHTQATDYQTSLKMTTYNEETCDTFIKAMMNLDNLSVEITYITDGLSEIGVPVDYHVCPFQDNLLKEIPKAFTTTTDKEQRDDIIYKKTLMDVGSVTVMTEIILTMLSLVLKGDLGDLNICGNTIEHFFKHRYNECTCNKGKVYSRLYFSMNAMIRKLCCIRHRGNTRERKERHCSNSVCKTNKGKFTPKSINTDTPLGLDPVKEKYCIQCWTKQDTIKIEDSDYMTKKDVITTMNYLCKLIVLLREQLRLRKAERLRRCTRCKQKYYCSKECQITHWHAEHHITCVPA